MTFKIRQGDCLEVLKKLPDNSVDLIFTSPPYEAARTYGIEFKLKGQEFVDWALARYIECVRVSKGLVAWVIEGQTRQFQWSASPVLLMADLHRAGVKLRKPPIFHRVGIPGSGGPDWLRNDYEFIICASKGKLPWSDNTAAGGPCKYGPGGEPSHRQSDGKRVSAKRGNATEPKPQAFIAGDLPPGSKLHTKSNGNTRRVQCYTPPAKANPGNRIQETYTTAEVTKLLEFQGNLVTCSVGGGRMGSALAHENEAPFPESLVDVFVRSFCPPGGLVLDPFMGSGTTLAVALKNGRKAMGIDLRDSQVDLTRRRLEQVQESLKNDI